MEFALMANVMLRGACLREAYMSGGQLDAADSPGPTSVTRIRVALDFAVRASPRPTSAMHGWVAHSSSEPRSAVPICAACICAWQGSTARICRMPTWMASKA
jgi:hypothetical protein